MKTVSHGSTPAISRFDEFYRTTTPPWVIGEPQPAVVELERAGLIRGAVLDIGCGTGEHTILLTRLGYDVVGIDFAPEAVEQARRNAEAKGVGARFEVADAMNLADRPGYDTIVDSALFHIFDDGDRPKYVASLHNACRSGRHRACPRALRRGPGVRPRGQRRDDPRRLRRRLGAGEPRADAYRGVVTEMHADRLGLAVGNRVDEPAWLARARKV